MKQITIIGLGRFGTELGLSLSGSSEWIRAGCDLKAEAENEALKSGAADKIIHDPDKAVAEADIILFAISADETADFFREFGKKIPEKASVFEFSLNKRFLFDLAARTLPKPERFSGLWKNKRLFICADVLTSPETIRSAETLGKEMGLSVAFCGIDEMDGLLKSGDETAFKRAFKFSDEGNQADIKTLLSVNPIEQMLLGGLAAKRRGGIK